MDDTRKRIHTATVQESEADTKKSQVERKAAQEERCDGYFISLSRDVQQFILKELRIKDLVIYMKADGPSGAGMKEDGFIWKQMAAQEYPYFHQNVELSGAKNYMRMLLRYDRFVTPFINKGMDLVKLENSQST